MRRPTPALALIVALAGCGTEITVSQEGVEEVIEEVAFAPSLGIDLTRMQRLSSGVYIEDLTVGSGEPVALGNTARLRFTGWLRTGTRFTQGEISFLLGNSEVIQGFEQGVQGMRVGGVRRMIIPPVLAFGSAGSSTVPPGAIVIYEAELLEYF